MMLPCCDCTACGGWNRQLMLLLLLLLLLHELLLPIWRCIRPVSMHQGRKPKPILW
jgi:hypothetical protein